MCRSIKTLFNVQEGVTEEEIRGACVQFVRKISGYRKPSKNNAVVFNQAVEDMTGVSRRLLNTLTTKAKARG